jgi:hypothetical protein
VVAATFLAAGAWRLGRLPPAATSVLADEACTIATPRKPRGNRGPETAHPPPPPLEWLPSHRRSRRVARRRARPVVIPPAPVESADRSVGGVEVLKGPQRCNEDRSSPGRPPWVKLVAVGDAHEVAIPRGLKVQAPEPHFEPG